MSSNSFDVVAPYWEISYLQICYLTYYCDICTYITVTYISCYYLRILLLLTLYPVYVNIMYTNATQCMIVADRKKLKTLFYYIRCCNLRMLSQPKFFSKL